MTQSTTTHPKGGWRQEEIDLLFSAVSEAAEQGKPLRDVFADVGVTLSRKPNSIRNFYYARVRETPELSVRQTPFRSFTADEVRPLLRRSDVSWTPETLVDYALVCYSAQMPDCAYAGFSNAIRMNPASVDALFKKRPELKSIWQELEKQQQQRSR